MWGEITWRGAGTFLAFIFVSLFAMTVLMAFDEPRPKPNTEWPPIYPGVQQVDVRINDSLPAGVTSTKAITYKAQARPETLVDFYREALAREGWLERQVPRSEPYFSYSDVGACWWYMLRLNVEQVNPQESTVHMKLSRWNCR